MLLNSSFKTIGLADINSICYLTLDCIHTVSFLLFSYHPLRAGGLPFQNLFGKLFNWNDGSNPSLNPLKIESRRTGSPSSKFYAFAHPHFYAKINYCLPLVRNSPLNRPQIPHAWSLAHKIGPLIKSPQLLIILPMVRHLSLKAFNISH